MIETEETPKCLQQEAANVSTALSKIEEDDKQVGTHGEKPFHMDAGTYTDTVTFTAAEEDVAVPTPQTFTVTIPAYTGWR